MKIRVGIFLDLNNVSGHVPPLSVAHVYYLSNTTTSSWTYQFLFALLRNTNFVSLPHLPLEVNRLRFICFHPIQPGRNNIPQLPLEGESTEACSLPSDSIRSE
jgi:hypothetical protein